MKHVLVLAFALWCLSPALARGDDCVDEAASRFRVPPSLIRAILAVEGGRSGAIVTNRNGSFDIGPMQINSSWLPEIEKRGGSLELILYHRCANIHVGTWILSRELAGVTPDTLNRSTFWRAVGNYHSRTPALNRRYAERVWAAWRRLQNGQNVAETEERRPANAEFLRSREGESNRSLPTPRPTGQ